MGRADFVNTSLERAETPIPIHRCRDLGITKGGPREEGNNGIAPRNAAAAGESSAIVSVVGIDTVRIRIAHKRRALGYSPEELALMEKASHQG
jgi:hypothetical protein